MITHAQILSIVSEYNSTHKIVYVNCTLNVNLDIYIFHMRRTDHKGVCIESQIGAIELYNHICPSILIFGTLDKMYNKLVKDSTRLSGGHLW